LVWVEGDPFFSHGYFIGRGGFVFLTNHFDLRFLSLFHPTVSLVVHSPLLSFCNQEEYRSRLFLALPFVGKKCRIFYSTLLKLSDQAGSNLMPSGL
jgi:hypothetical protein